MMVVTVKKEKETTRITVGCPDLADNLVQKLRRKGFMVKSKSMSEHLTRSDAERQRAVNLIAIAEAAQ